MHYSVLILAFVSVLRYSESSPLNPIPELPPLPPAPIPPVRLIPTLKQTHIIFRHGDRAPISLYPNDPNKGYKWPFSLAQLTNIGKLQQYELGTYLRNRYEDYFSTNPQEIEVTSSDKDRCISSTQVNLAAFFKPKGKWIWKDNLEWQPVPIHTKPKNEDWILNEDAHCPAADIEANKLMESPDGLAYTEKYRDVMAYYAEKSGKVVKDPTSVAGIYGIIWIETIKNLTIPEWVRPRWAELTAAANDGFVVKYKSRLTQRLRGGPILNDVIQKMKNRSTQTEEALPKGYMYSTHDAIIAALTSAMGVFNGQTVPYCATVLMELYQQPLTNAHTVRLFYRNTTEHEPFQLKVPGCDLDCPLDQFEELMTEVTPHDIKSECNRQSN